MRARLKRLFPKTLEGYRAISLTLLIPALSGPPLLSLASSLITPVTAVYLGYGLAPIAVILSLSLLKRIHRVEVKYRNEWEVTLMSHEIPTHLLCKGLKGSKPFLAIIRKGYRKTIPLNNLRISSDLGRAISFVGACSDPLAVSSLVEEMENTRSLDPPDLSLYVSPAEGPSLQVKNLYISSIGPMMSFKELK